MRQKTEYELAVAMAKKAVRSAIRLRYSLLADQELNKILPEVERDMADALERGVEFELDTDRYFRGLPG